MTTPARAADADGTGVPVPVRVWVRVRADGFRGFGAAGPAFLAEPRFARDQPPDKPHLDLAFWEGPHGPRRDPALILRLAPAEIRPASGRS